MAPQGAIDTLAFAAKAKRALLSLLGDIPGKKNLVIERSLVGPIELFCDFKTLQEHGVDRVFFLDNQNADSTQRNVLFLARGDRPVQAQAVAKQIKLLQESSDISHEFSIAWVPRRTLLCERILEQVGVLGEATSLELPLYFQPLDEGLLSLELEDSFSSLYLDKDPSCLHTAAKALMLIQEQHGLFPRIIGKGDNAARIAELLQRMRTEYASTNPSVLPTTASMPSTTLENLIIIDRETDMVSPLLTQLTYEGLLDEIFAIRHNATEIETSIIGGAPTSAQTTSTEPTPSTALTRKINLSYTDTLYSSLRHVHFTLAGPLLNRVARRLQSSYESRHTQSTTAELKSFVQKLPAYQAEAASLKTHTSLLDALLQRTNSAPLFRAALEAQQALASGNYDASAVRDAVEDLAARNAPLHTVLRLLCLESCCSGGLRARDLETARRIVVHAYGPQHLLTLDALQSMGLIRERGALPFSVSLPSVPGAAALRGAGGGDGAEAAAAVRAAEAQPTNYYALRRPMALLLEDVSEEDPQDIAYVYSGYAPLSVRLVQAVLQKTQLAKLARSSLGSAANGTSGGAVEANGWKGFESVLGNVRGRTVDEVQSNQDKAVRSRAVLAGAAKESSGGGSGLKTSVVMFVGGITFAEIAALKFISRQEEEAGRRKLVICTTNVISGEKMMAAAIARSRDGRTA